MSYSESFQLVSYFQNLKIRILKRRRVRIAECVGGKKLSRNEPKKWEISGSNQLRDAKSFGNPTEVLFISAQWSGTVLQPALPIQMCGISLTFTGVCLSSLVVDVIKVNAVSSCG